MRTMAFLISGSLLFAGAAPAAIICVNEAGSAGCESSIQDGIDAADDGDTVSVRSGTYFENVVIPAGKDGLTLRGSGDNTIIDPEAGPLDGEGITVLADDTTIERLKVRNGQEEGIFIAAVASGTTIQDVTVTGPDEDCIGADGPGTQVLDSELLGCGDQAIDIANDDATVNDVTMENVDSGCLEINGDRAVVRNSTCTVSEDDDCFEIVGDDAEVVNNRADSCNGDGFSVTGDNWMVERNRSTATTSDGFNLECDDCSSARAASNRAQDIGDDADAFSLSGDGATIESNRAEDVADQAFDVSGDDNIVRRNQAKRIGGDSGEECYFINGDDNMVERNVADICHGPGFFVSGDDNIVTNNSVTNARESGFEVSSGAGNVLEDNSASDVNHFGYQVNTTAVNTDLIDDTARGSNRADLCNQGVGTDNQSPQLDDIVGPPCAL